jgi:alpha-L-fucosidase
MVRQLQPDIIINNRSLLPEDYDTPEQHIQASDPGRPWEACMTLNDNWGYNAADDNWKTPKQVLQNLVRCASGGGNFLLNVGPKPDGTIPTESVRTLEKVGKWLDINGGSIYGTQRSPLRSSTGMSTIKGTTLYMHVFRWPGREITFSQIASKVRSVHLLATGKQVKFEQKADRLMLKGLPGNAPSKLDTVIVVELEDELRVLDYFQDGWEVGTGLPRPTATPASEEPGEAVDAESGSGSEDEAV